jgi:hypothetical protein
LDHRLGDAARRERRGTVRHDVALKAEIDQIFDHVQAVESLLPLRGSDSIRLAAAVLISRATKADATEIDEFFKIVYQVRDDVMHGRLDKSSKTRMLGSAP